MAVQVQDLIVAILETLQLIKELKVKIMLNIKELLEEILSEEVLSPSLA